MPKKGAPARKVRVTYRKTSDHKTLYCDGAIVRIAEGGGNLILEFFSGSHDVADEVLTLRPDNSYSTTAQVTDEGRYTRTVPVSIALPSSSLDSLVGQISQALKAVELQKSRTRGPRKPLP